VKTIFINRFDGGMVQDPRSGGARAVTNFDVHTNPYSLTPYRDSESGDSASSTSQKQNFAYALSVGGAFRFFALGVKATAITAEILYKDDFSNATWSTVGTTAKYQAASGTTAFDLFVYYRYATVANSRIFGASAGTRIWSYDPTGTADFDDAGHNLTYTKLAQGLVFSKDDILYIPYDNKIAKNNQGSWTDAALTLPSHLYITSIAEYGNYLAIACAPLSGLGNSVVYLWDRDSSLATLSDLIDWGEGDLKVLEEVGGYLIGVSVNQSNKFAGDITFRYYAGAGGAHIFQKLRSETITNFVAIAKQKVADRLFFAMKLTINGTRKEGIWSVGRVGDRFSIIHERTPNNDTLIENGLLSIKNFKFTGDYLFISYLDASSVYQLSKTNDQAVYSHTSIWESGINPNMPEEDKSQITSIVSVGANYVALPAAGQIVVKHRIQGGTYKTLFTETTDGITFTEPVGSYADGTFFTPSKEHEFRIESTGGAVCTGLIYKYRVHDSNS